MVENIPQLYVWDRGLFDVREVVYCAVNNYGSGVNVIVRLRDVPQSILIECDNEEKALRVLTLFVVFLQGIVRNCTILCESRKIRISKLRKLTNLLPGDENALRTQDSRRVAAYLG